MSNVSAADAKSSRPDDGARGCLIGCLIIAALGIIAVFPWVSNLPPQTFTFEKHYSVVIPPFLAQYLPPGYPTEIPIFQPPYQVELPNLQGVIISLVITSLACLLFMILYALRNTVPWIVRLALGVVGILLLILMLKIIVGWLLSPSG